MNNGNLVWSVLAAVAVCGFPLAPAACSSSSNNGTSGDSGAPDAAEDVSMAGDATSSGDDSGEEASSSSDSSMAEDSSAATDSSNVTSDSGNPTSDAATEASGGCVQGSCPNHLACGNNACLTSCGSDDATGDLNCTPSSTSGGMNEYWCDGTMCQPTGASGSACTRNSECQTGMCVASDAGAGQICL